MTILSDTNQSNNLFNENFNTILSHEVDGKTVTLDVARGLATDWAADGVSLGDFSEVELDEMNRIGELYRKYDRIPTEIKEKPQWILWSMVNGSKIPKQVSGENARTNDSSTFSTFREVLVTYADSTDKFSGIAFVITDGDDLTGVDLDTCLEPDGSVKPWAAEIISSLIGTSYGEVSPSGKGVKFLSLGKKKIGAKAVKPFGGPKEQVEVYSRSRFWAITGDTFDAIDNGVPFEPPRSLTDAQEAIDRLCDKYLGTCSEAKPQEPQHAVSRAPSGRTNELLSERCYSYVEGCENQLEGGRDNKAFNIAGNLLAIDVDGQKPSHELVLNALVHWDRHNSPPLGRECLAQKVKSAAKNGTPRALKPSDRIDTRSYSLAPLESVDLSELQLEAMGEEADKQAEACRLETLEEIVNTAPNFIREFYRHAESRGGEFLPESILLSGLAIASTACSGKVFAYMGKEITLANLYLLFTAPSGAGKDDARRLITATLRGAGATSEENGVIGGQDPRSDVGIYRALDGHHVKLLSIDEFNNDLKGLQDRRMAKWSPLNAYLCLYRAGGEQCFPMAMSGERGTEHLTRPHLNLYCTGTEYCWTEMDENVARNGFLGRLIAWGCMSKVETGLPERHKELPQDLLDSIRAWLECPYRDPGDIPASINPEMQAPTLVKFSDEAFDILQARKKSIERQYKTSSFESVLMHRSCENASRLALIAACMDMEVKGLSREDMRERVGELVVGERHARWAELVIDTCVSWTIEQIEGNLSSNQVEAGKLKILKIVKEAGPKGLPRSVLTKKTRSLKAHDRSQYLGDLIESGEIYRAEVKAGSKGGRPSERLWHQDYKPGGRRE